ncbi:hypothetical protein L8C07_18705 [Paenibacillus sp. CMAA1739]|uniref:hypothetical protein n=1 Tax=Paenibacillus ottowii TaxID=2315729 RepID=UPI00272FAA01|nr:MULTISPECIES: hypothetical protein [Paenibacillus]MDP1510011.1 hypothetical protein [Paenibacillus ottowii]MEC4567978.1 hypothetical protein [Paenibacillus sp. CMAA1739]
MKSLTLKYAIAFLSGIVLVGSASGFSIVNANRTLHPNTYVQSSVLAVNPSVYQSITKFKKSETPNQLTWTEKNITLVAKKIERENVPSSEKRVITSITIKKGDKNYTLKTDEYHDKLRDISSAVVSPSNTWLAIQAQRGAGSTLLLINLTTGKSIIVNDLLKAKGKRNIESITAYNWSPKEDQIAFSYGDTSSSSIAIYNTKTDAFIYLPRETNYISTSLILWHKSGKNIDYISEYPSDQKKLYRYSMDSKKVKTVKKMSQIEFQQWFKLDKYTTN